MWAAYDAKQLLTMDSRAIYNGGICYTLTEAQTIDSVSLRSFPSSLGDFEVCQDFFLEKWYQHLKR